MFSDNESTTIVVGAGAGKPYGLPLGRELRDSVLKIPTGDYPIRLLNQFGISKDTFRDFRDDLQMSAISTVDSFLEKRPIWMKVGKIAMALALDGKENELKLFPPHHPKDHWYESLWQSLNCKSWTSLKKKKLRVISFNYDRTLECYLCGVIANNFRITRSKVAGWLSEEFIVHPHGTLGSYRGESLNPWALHRPNHYERIKEALKCIIVISEANPKTVSFVKARKALDESHNLVFLGFGYHEKNMERLGFPTICQGRSRAICASHKGIPKDGWNWIYKYYFKKPFADKRNWPSLSRLVSESI